jgi:hypothetical protein
VPSLDNGQTFQATLANPFPDGLRLPAGAGSGLKTTLGRVAAYVDPGQRAAYMQRWSFNVQQIRPGRLLLEAGYLGNRGTGLGIAQDLNPVPAAYLSASPERDQPRINFLQDPVPNPFFGLPEFTGTALQGRTVPRSRLLVPYPHFTGVQTTLTGGFSWYHALLARIEKRLARGATFQAAYTWSKAMEAMALLNATDLHPHHAISQFDRPHRLSASGMYDLPFGRRYAGWQKQILGGWSVQGIYLIQTGPPLNFGNVLFRGDIKNIPLPEEQRTVERWFNTDAGFETTVGRQLTSNIRTFPLRLSGVRGAGFHNVDLSVFKNFQLRERLRLQLRGEATNAFNRANFNVPNTNPSASLFGQITAGDPEQRRVTLALKLLW